MNYFSSFLTIILHKELDLIVVVCVKNQICQFLIKTSFIHNIISYYKAECNLVEVNKFLKY